MNRTPLFHLSDEKIAPELKTHQPVPYYAKPETRYPHIESIRIIQHTNTPSATVKIRRRRSNSGGPAVVRTYQVYDVRWLMIWQACQTMLFKIHYEAKP